MAKPKINYIKFLSPRFTGVYPHLNKPDTKYGKPEFKVNGRASHDDFAEMVATIESILEKITKASPDVLETMHPESHDKLRAAIKAKKLKHNDPSFLQEVDSEGNELGTTLLKFKKNAEYKDDKTGLMMPTKLPLFDAKKAPVRSDIWGGSIIRVSGHYIPWLNAKNEYGVKLAMDAVQVLEMKSGGSGGSPDSYGFDEEEGWAQPEATTSVDADSAAPSASDESDF